MTRVVSEPRLETATAIYGVLGAIEAVRMGKRVVVLEQDLRILGSASAVNQARVHNGYHYPRSVTTAIRSRANYRRFLADFADAVEHPTAFYAIARRQSKVTAAQFERFVHHERHREQHEVRGRARDRVAAVRVKATS